MQVPLTSSIAPSATLVRATPRRLQAELHALVSGGARLQALGTAARNPKDLLRRYPPLYAVDLFGTRFYLSTYTQEPSLRFFVAFLVQPRPGSRRVVIHPRIIYKDVSLVWRCASHLVFEDREEWVGKGDAVTVVEDGYEITDSMEFTTDLPLELQMALEEASRGRKRIPTDYTALRRVLRRAPPNRVRAFDDFVAPRRRAASVPENLLNGGKPVAWFDRENDPTSLRFASGFAPDFEGGLVEVHESKSSLYGGVIRRHRVVSANRRVQYAFFAAPRHAWVMPPQATTTELSSYGVRTIDALHDDNLCVPGYEYHFMDESQDPPFLVSQIPPGFAGEVNAQDKDRADASAWIDALPVIQEFRSVLVRPGADLRPWFGGSTK